ncbi:MAG: SPFH/Band 7/PHB domain protein [Chloroflexi bacterium]|jgi:regulator of protease activity HflC (stomatin/prohibitin superfamily)|nr:SPFH/Band 7/PHB domain protein [Chloroflexota bacterium]MCX5989262.1 SPFH/Band 7/PHB domain protein [Chloroflexota bacterium]RLT54996.1 MAG: SPFH/Band 7/PHB domain protein [Chloroflexota bacterium]RLT59214.1 MAG: SPFH/Band 7/PHB domain protein [Chloroflexota bacterium]
MADAASTVVTVILGLALVAVAYVIIRSARIVDEYKRLVVFRLGRSVGQRGPGLVLLVPFLDTATEIDLREQFIEVPHQTCITRDNAPIDIDFLIYTKVMDAVLTVVQVRNFAGAAQGLATTTLRAVIGDILLDDVLARREEINERLRAKLDEVTERWGVKITSVEIREIVPPQEILAAMNRQMTAERQRRAQVLEAEGQQQASILVAEGEKEASILRATGEREAATLRAEGFATALQTLFATAKRADANTISLQYLETIRAIATGPAQKWVIPADLVTALGRVTGSIAQGQSKTPTP